MRPQIVHEAEVHRQHVRLRIPVGVEIDGTRYTADDWSMGGFGVVGSIPSRQADETFTSRLILPFEDFEVALQVECQMVYVDAAGPRFGARFLTLSQGQHALFRYLLDAYLSGEIVQGGDLLSIAGRDNTAAARLQSDSLDPTAEQTGWGRRVGRYAGFAALLALGLALVAFVTDRVRTTYFVITTDRARIEAPVTRVRAATAGALEQAAGAEALLRAGEVVARLRAADGTVTALPSPCECVVLDWEVPQGQVVEAGAAVATLVAADRPLTVRAEVSVEEAIRLHPGQPAEVTVPGQPVSYRGQVEALDNRTPLRGQRDPIAPQATISVIVRPDQPFEFEDLGAIVHVRFL